MDQASKDKHSKRIHQKEVYAKKQNKIGKRFGNKVISEKHAEVSAMNCGNSNCVMCGNPRKFLGELTIQEQRMFQDNENF